MDWVVYHPFRVRMSPKYHLRSVLDLTGNPTITMQLNNISQNKKTLRMSTPTAECAIDALTRASASRCSPGYEITESKSNCSMSTGTLSAECNWVKTGSQIRGLHSGMPIKPEANEVTRDQLVGTCSKRDPFCTATGIPNPANYAGFSSP